jgi:DNA polymerase III subunit beta
MISFQIKWSRVKAAACMVAKQETRFYLNGVCMEHRPSGPVFVGTDGHRLLAARHDWMEDEPPAAFQNVIIPMGLIKRVKLSRRDEGLVTIALERNPATIRITTKSEVFVDQEIAGSFPGWRNILPTTEPSGVPGLMNAHYLASFQDAMAALDVRADIVPLLVHNDAGPTLVDVHNNDAFGVIMPVRDMRLEPPIREVPAWAKV